MLLPPCFSTSLSCGTPQSHHSHPFCPNQWHFDLSVLALALYKKTLHTWGMKKTSAKWSFEPDVFNSKCTTYSLGLNFGREILPKPSERTPRPNYFLPTEAKVFHLCLNKEIMKCLTALKICRKASLEWTEKVCVYLRCTFTADEGDNIVAANFFKESSAIYSGLCRWLWMAWMRIQIFHFSLQMCNLPRLFYFVL